MCNAQKKTSLESSLLQHTPTLNGNDSLQLEDWLTDIETVSELAGENRIKLAQAKSRGLVRTLILEALTLQKNLGGNKGLSPLKNIQLRHSYIH